MDSLPNGDCSCGASADMQPSPPHNKHPMQLRIEESGEDGKYNTRNTHKVGGRLSDNNCVACCSGLTVNSQTSGSPSFVRCSLFHSTTLRLLSLHLMKTEKSKRCAVK